MYVLVLLIITLSWLESVDKCSIPNLRKNCSAGMLFTPLTVLAPSGLLRTAGSGSSQDSSVQQFESWEARPGQAKNVFVMKPGGRIVRGRFYTKYRM